MKFSRAVFVIHNMAHQGRGPFVETEALELPDHYRCVLRLAATDPCMAAQHTPHACRVVQLSACRGGYTCIMLSREASSACSVQSVQGLNMLLVLLQGGVSAV
jgi:hypothetical protein